MGARRGLFWGMGRVIFLVGRRYMISVDTVDFVDRNRCPPRPGCPQGPPGFGRWRRQEEDFYHKGISRVLPTCGPRGGPVFVGSFTTN